MRQYTPMLNWDQMREMNRGGIDFGCHTQSHPILTSLSDAELYAELRQSKARLEDELSCTVRPFAYPNGRPGDFDERTRQAVRATGFSSACTTIAGRVAAGTDAFQLPRVAVVDGPIDQFALRVALAWRPQI